MIWISDIFDKVSIFILGFILLTGSGLVFGSDWPMYGHDIRRSGASSDQIYPPVQRRWYREFAKEGLINGIQPAVAGNILYIGTMQGKLHAINLDDGKDKWVFNLPGGIFCSVAYSDNTVYAVSGNGILYAVDAESGNKKWIYDTGSGLAILSSPLPHNNIIYFGSRDKAVYAVNKDGNLLWKTELGGPVVTALALDSDKNMIIAACEDMQGYSLNSLNGKQLWKSDKMQGITFYGYYPVVVQGKGVFFSTRPFWCSWWKLGEGGHINEAMIKKFLGIVKSEKKKQDGSLMFPDEEFVAMPNWRFTQEQNSLYRKNAINLMQSPGFVKKYYSAIIDYYKKHPEERVMFYFDLNTGKRKGIIPYIYGEQSNGTTQPPLILADGRIVVNIASLFPDQYSIVKKEPAFLNSDTGMVLEMVNPAGAGLSFMPDEMCSLSTAGNMLISSRQSVINGYDIKLKKREHNQDWYSGMHDYNKGYPVDCTIRYLRGMELPEGVEYLPHGAGIYSGGGGIDNPSAVAGDLIFYIPQHEGSAGCVLICLEKGSKQGRFQKEPAKKPDILKSDILKAQKELWDWDFLYNGWGAKYFPDKLKKIKGTIGNPDYKNKGISEKISDEELLKIIYTPVKTNKSKINKQLQNKLMIAVKELISTHWAPLAFPESREPNEGGYIFADPSEIFYTAGLAWPYLDNDLQVELKSYCDKLFLQYNPMSLKSLDGSIGTRRENYEVYYRYTPISFLMREPGIERLYPIWLFSVQTGDWKWLKENLEDLKKYFHSIPAGSRIEKDGGNAKLSGLIAGFRIAVHFDDKDLQNIIMPVMLQTIRKRIEYENNMTRGGVYYYNAISKMRAGPSRWIHLNRDIAGICKKYASETQEYLVANYIDHNRPTWYIAWNIVVSHNHESCLNLPINAMAHYQAKMLLTDTSAAEVKTFIDIPWCKADLYYIQKIALALDCM